MQSTAKKTSTLQLLPDGNILVLGTGHGHGQVWIGCIREDLLPEFRLKYFGVKG